MLFLMQVVLAARVVGRLLRTGRGVRIERDEAGAGGERVTVVVPVLDERARLAPCLDGLLAQGPEVAEILVVDGGSTDGTPALVAEYARRDRRVRLIEAGAAPLGWNGKARNLQVGLERADAGSAWLLTVDADVRPAPALARSLLAFARREGLPALSVATLQELSGAAEALLHPALLSTLVYRFGIPGSATDRVGAVQANGQCFLARRDALAAVGGFAGVAGSLAEDVSLARALAAAGHRVGFYETDGLVSVAMYAGWRDAWRNWTRSLPLRDRYSGAAGWLGLAEVALVQALPLPLAIGLWLRGRRRADVRNPSQAGPPRGGATPVGAGPAPPLAPTPAADGGRSAPRAIVRRGRSVAERGGGGLAGGERGRGMPRPDRSRSPRRPGRPPASSAGLGTATGAAPALLRLNAALAAVRLGVLAGTARAYPRRPWTYWLSPICDVPAAVGVWLSAGRRAHRWRGRPIVRGGPR